MCIDRNFMLPKRILRSMSQDATVVMYVQKNIVSESSLMMEQRAIGQFLILKKLSARDITADLEGLYRHEALSLSAMKKWRMRFVNGRITLEDALRSRGPP
jgi:hypothetical protein